MTAGTLLVTAVLMAAATAGPRILPFLVGDRLTHPFLRRLFADLFPPAVLSVLVLYFAWNAATAPEADRLAQAAGALATVAAHLGLRNLLVSVASGTGVCMLALHLLAG